MHMLIFIHIALNVSFSTFYTDFVNYKGSIPLYSEPLA